MVLNKQKDKPLQLVDEMKVETKITKATKKCEICGGKSFGCLFEKFINDFGVSERFMFYECMNCSSISIFPRLSPKELEKYYTKDYYAFNKILTKNESIKVKLRLFFYILYYSNNDNYYLKTLLSPFKFLIRGTKIISGIKLLDVGCGAGQFLYEMKECGLEVYGIEPGIISVPKWLNIKPDLIKAGYPKETFDLITMNHVLQHVADSVGILKEIHRTLKRDGIFIVSAANNRSLAYKLFGKNWFQLDVPRHLVNYSDNILIQFLELYNFKVIKNRHNSRPNQFVESLYHVLNIKKKYKILTRLLEVIFLPLTWMVNIFKIGDQVEIWCVKSGGSE